MPEMLLPSGSPSRRHVLTAATAVFAVTAVVFAPALRNELLLWDDACYTWQNDRIAQLDLGLIAWAFGDYGCNFWAPLTWISLAADRAIWGGSAFGYHLTNVLLHAGNAALILLVALELLRLHPIPSQGAPEERRRDGRYLLGGAVLASLLFALHPLRVESVAWAAERKDVLSLFFGLLAILAWLRHVAAPRASTSGGAAPAMPFWRSPTYWGAFFLLGLSLLAKPMLVTLPAILLLLDWRPLGRLAGPSRREAVLEKVPLFAISVAVTLVAVGAQAPQRMPLSQAGVASRLLIAARSVVEYLRLTVWPAEVSPFYLHPGNVSAVAPAYLGSAILLVLLTAGCISQSRRRPALLVAWMAWLAALVPILGFSQVGPQAMAARFTYFPSLPLCVLAGAAVAGAVFLRPPSWPPRLLATATALWLAAAAALTLRDLGHWKDDVTLWSRVIELTPNPPGRAYFQRALGWVQRGQPSSALDDLTRALEIATSKGYSAPHQIYLERGGVLLLLGRPMDAVDDYTRALATARGQARAEVLMARAAAWRALGEDASAALDFESAAGER